MKNSATTNCDRRVAIIYRLSEPGGVQSVVLSLIKGLNNQGIIPDILWDTPPNPDMLSERKAAAGYLPIRFRVASRIIERVPITARYLLRSANVIYSSQLPRKYQFYYIFYNGFLVDDGTPHVRYLSGPPLLPQLEMVSPGLRGLPFQAFRWLYRSSLRHYVPAYEYHQNSQYVINSQYTARLFQEAHGISLPVVHPPINLAGRTFHEGDLHQRDTITFFSRFVDYKRPEMVLGLAKVYPHHRFVFMGGVKKQNRGYFEHLRLSAEGLQNVTFFDNPPDQKVYEELLRTRFFIFPAANEHFGMATAEAIGSGAVPFVHDSGGQREIVPDERLRFDDTSFASKFEALLSLSDETLNEIRSRLRSHIEQFSEQAFVKKMLAFMSIDPESEMKDELQATTN